MRTKKRKEKKTTKRKATRARTTKTKEDIKKGGEDLAAKLNKKESIDDRELRELVAGILKVSPLGITILQGTPYLNKIGRKQKLEEYGKKKQRVIYKFQRYSRDDTDKAICLAQIVEGKNKNLTDWVVGECSPSSMGMSTLKGYQNHMAQTRAHNRVIEELYGVRIHEDMLKGLAKSKVKDIEINTGVSAEEVNLENGAVIGQGDAESMFESAKNMTAEISDKKTLEELKIKFKGSKIYSDGQKEELIKIVDSKIKTI